jgi:hypothetical protein
MNWGIIYVGFEGYPEAEAKYTETLKPDPIHASNHSLCGITMYVQLLILNKTDYAKINHLLRSCVPGVIAG